MKLCNSEQEYIDAIAPAAQRACKRYGYLPSVLIAQSCHENGYGIPSYWDNPQILALMSVNNMVGIKSELLNASWVPELSVWRGVSIKKDTPEQYGSQIVTIKDDFRVYEDIEQSFVDYLCFMTYASNYGKGGTPKYGREVLDCKDPATLIRMVSQRGYATGKTYPDAIIKKIKKHNLTKYDDLSGVQPTNWVPEGYKKEENPVNSPLVSYTKLNKNNSGKRQHAIDRITPHCVVGQMSIEDLLGWLSSTTGKGACSANYGIGNDGRVGLNVPEDCRAWTSSSSANDNRAVTIECASDKTHPYAFRDVVYKKLIELCVDICKRNGKDKLLWLGSKEKTEGYNPGSREMVLSAHRWYAAKECPGDWLYGKYGELAKKVTEALGGQVEPVNPPSPTGELMYKVQVGAYSNKKNAEIKLRQVSSAGFDCFITDKEIDGYYRVQCGAYVVKDNATRKMYELQNAGFDCFIKEYKNGKPIN